MPSFVRSRDAGIRTLHGTLAEAPDNRVKRIVATIDAMATRGAADELIAPLRPRLGGMRPTRPLRFARLLFLPLDPVVVPAAIWLPDQGTIPRTAISPITKVVEAAIGEDANSIKSRIKKHTTDDLDLIGSVGGMLWPRAGEVLAGADVPESWTQTGLKDQMFHDLAAKIGGLLRQAITLDRMVAETADGLLPPNRHLLETMIREVSAPRINALPMLTTLLLSRLPQTARLLYTIESGSAAKAIRGATDRSADLLLGQLDADDAAGSLLAGSNLAQSGAAVKRIASMLRELDRDTTPAARRAMIRRVKTRLIADCKTRFAAGVKAEILDRLEGLSGPLTASDLVKLEAMARSLRVLEHEGRAVGNSAVYDEVIGQATNAVRAPPVRECLSLTDRVRLLEILDGPDAALDLLERSGRSG